MSSGKRIEGVGGREKAPSRGFTLLELMLAMVVLTIAIGGITVSLWHTGALMRTNRETGSALDAAHSVLETMHAAEFSEVFARYNAIGADDPALGLSPGNLFSVTGLTAQAADADGFVGSVLFPGDGIELREDTVDRDLGMPRDLNGDGQIDSVNHADNYQVLPLRVQIEWVGAGGSQRLDLVTTIAAR